MVIHVTPLAVDIFSVLFIKESEEHIRLHSGVVLVAVIFVRADVCGADKSILALILVQDEGCRVRVRFIMCVKEMSSHYSSHAPDAGKDTYEQSTEADEDGDDGCAVLQQEAPPRNDGEPGPHVAWS